MQLRKGPVGNGDWSANNSMTLQEYEGQCVWETRTGGWYRESLIQVEIFPADFEEVLAACAKAEPDYFSAAVTVILSDEQLATMIQNKLKYDREATMQMIAQAIINSRPVVKTKPQLAKAAAQ